MLARLRRGWAEMAGARGLEAIRLFNLAELDPIVGGTPSLTRWALLCTWRDGPARDDFLADGSRLAPLLRGAHESCHLALETVRTKDSWQGWSLPSEQRGRFAADEPVVAQLLERVDPAVDLSEPFARIREAVAEARKTGVTNRAA